jgi:hypothetical protein
MRNWAKLGICSGVGRCACPLKRNRRKRGGAPRGIGNIPGVTSRRTPACVILTSSIRSWPKSRRWDITARKATALTAARTWPGTCGNGRTAWTGPIPTTSMTAGKARSMVASGWYGVERSITSPVSCAVPAALPMMRRMTIPAGVFECVSRLSDLKIFSHR